MGKKDKQYDQPVLPETTTPTLKGGTAQGRPESLPQDTPASAPDVSKTYFFIFWGIIVLAAAAAWILAIVLPGVRESIIERWLMVALAASLAVFLLVYK